MNNPSATFQFGRVPFSQSQPKSTIQNGSVATSSAARLDEI